MQKRKCMDKDLSCKANNLGQNVILMQYHTYFQGFATHTFKEKICAQKEFATLTRLQICKCWLETIRFHNFFQFSTIQEMPVIGNDKLLNNNDLYAQF